MLSHYTIMRLDAAEHSILDAAGAAHLVFTGGLVPTHCVEWRMGQKPSRRPNSISDLRVAAPKSLSGIVGSRMRSHERAMTVARCETPLATTGTCHNAGRR